MKNQLLTHCILIARNRVEGLEKELNSTREATTSESRSTAGDKHETGRAMMHLEQEKLHKQLAEARSILIELERIDSKVEHRTVQLGAMVATPKASFLIAAGLGKVQLEGVDHFVVSARSPVAKAMMGKKVGETFTVNGTDYAITTLA